MIPRKLRVRNFMCYRDDLPPLDFSGIHLACLTGANGHGKSALLDAMTWALWGKARAKRDDELIHLGQSEMEVEFTFDLQGTVYRVLRKRDSAKRGQTVLDLQVQESADQERFRSISEAGVRATQETIIRLLRMDYETFTNSSFLLQGRADAFTTRTPAERKHVLGEILGLGRYDEYEQRAKELARVKDRQVAELDGLLRDIERELANQPQYEAESAEAEARVEELSQAVAEAEAALKDLRNEKQRLESQQTRLRDVERRRRQAEEELNEIRSQISDRQRRLKGYQETLAERSAVEEGYAALVGAREAEAAWNERLATYARLRNKQRELERVVEAARHELELDLGRLGERAREWEGRAASRPALEVELQEIHARLAQLADRQAERDSAQDRVQVLAEESAGLTVRNDQLRSEMEALKEKIDLLEGEAAEATCPLCGQALSDEHRNEVVSQFSTQGKALGDAYRSNTARRQAIAEETQHLASQIGRLDRALVGLVGEQRRQAQLEQALGEALQAEDELGIARRKLTALGERLQSGDYARTDQEELGLLSAELEALGYDQEAHERARGEVASLVSYDETYLRLQTAVERVEEESKALDALWPRQDRWQEALARDKEQQESLASEVLRLPAVSASVEAGEKAAEELKRQSSKARLSLGAARQKLEYCRRLAVEREGRLPERQSLAEEKLIFDELRLAFGKKGVQAMIIEAAIPEIEFEANHLLSRMTAGRMHVRFETQRETLKGDTIETLDIYIADELGTRPYELFSGGEAFRVNFAIRIALSKLLARRAGAQLQLLVIDEGFGTQDAEGRERLVEAINSIQDDFARILVITHIEELKDAFPVRIEVVKTPNGSQFSLN